MGSYGVFGPKQVCEIAVAAAAQHRFNIPAWALQLVSMPLNPADARGHVHDIEEASFGPNGRGAQRSPCHHRICRRDRAAVGWHLPARAVGGVGVRRGCGAGGDADDAYLANVMKALVRLRKAPCANHQRRALAVIQRRHRVVCQCRLGLRTPARGTYSLGCRLPIRAFSRLPTVRVMRLTAREQPAAYSSLPFGRNDHWGSCATPSTRRGMPT